MQPLRKQHNGSANGAKAAIAALALERKKQRCSSAQSLDGLIRSLLSVRKFLLAWTRDEGFSGILTEITVSDRHLSDSREDVASHAINRE